MVLEDMQHSALSQLHSRKAQFKNGSCVVEMLDLRPVGASSMCSSARNFELVLERTPYRLSHIPQDRLEHTLPVFRDILKGYLNLTQWHRSCSFDVSTDMIGLTAEGAARVWFNSEFDKNQPQVEIVASSLQDTEHNLLEKLLEIFH
jgi:hypothetical protein